MQWVECGVLVPGWWPIPLYTVTRSSYTLAHRTPCMTYRTPWPLVHSDKSYIVVHRRPWPPSYTLAHRTLWPIDTMAHCTPWLIVHRPSYTVAHRHRGTSYTLAQRHCGPSTPWLIVHRGPSTQWHIVYTSQMEQCTQWHAYNTASYSRLYKTHNGSQYTLQLNYLLHFQSLSLDIWCKSDTNVCI